MIDLDNYNFKLPLQMRWNDMDALGHVNNAIFITYFEIGRGHYMLEACPGWDWSKHMFLIGNVNANFHKELLLNAINPEVWIKTTKIGSKSFTLEYAVLSIYKGERVAHASGTTTQIMFEMKTRKTIEVEDWVREKLTTFDPPATSK